MPRILNGPGTKSRLLKGPETFFGPLNGTSDSEGHFGAKKVEGTSKSQDFVPGPFRILEMAPVSDFQGLISNYPATFTAQ